MFGSLNGFALQTNRHSMPERTFVSSYPNNMIHYSMYRNNGRIIRSYSDIWIAMLSTNSMNDIGIQFAQHFMKYPFAVLNRIETQLG